MSNFAWGKEETQFFFDLTPDRVLDAVEASGLKCTGRCMALNSMENRVYEVELEIEDESQIKTVSDRFRVVKFYRPGRWNVDQILEEHRFLLDLNENEIPAIAPLPFPDGATLQKTSMGIHYALFPKVGGRSPDELSLEQLERIGRLLARIHNTGASGEARHRIHLDPKTYGEQNLAYLVQSNQIPLEWKSRYVSAVEKICSISEPWFKDAAFQRIHGDCHFGNLLWNDEGPFFLDFDDMVCGPCVQDLWLVVPGRDEPSRQSFQILLEAYEQMRDFDRKTLKLIEPLRALRFVHFSAWISKRWQDPAFPRAFPEFGSLRYWEEQTMDLEKQLALISEVV